MFIEEVQNLTVLTTFMLSKMINNIFYYFDTTQTITKGVTFRFEEL
jgi:hypothetical protein